MVIYNIGLPRTGTKSVSVLLGEYGYRVNHPNFKTLDFRYEYFKENIDQWCADNTVYSNTPVWHPEFWSMVGIEKHKIIHTYRDQKSWVASMMNYPYFRKGILLPRDVYWFKTYFGGFDYDNLMRVWDLHLRMAMGFKDAIHINILEDDNETKTIKICDYLGIEHNSDILIKNVEYEIKYNNTLQ